MDPEGDCTMVGAGARAREQPIRAGIQEITSLSTYRKRKANWKWAEAADPQSLLPGMCSLQQGCTSRRCDHLPQTASPTGYHVFKYWSSWETFLIQSTASNSSDISHSLLSHENTQTPFFSFKNKVNQNIHFVVVIYSQPNSSPWPALTLPAFCH